MSNKKAEEKEEISALSDKLSWLLGALPWCHSEEQSDEESQRPFASLRVTEFAQGDRSGSCLLGTKGIVLRAAFSLRHCEERSDEAISNQVKEE